MPRSKIISFEGIDGVGKTTQIKRLQTYLQDKGLKVASYKEPGGTPIGEEIRRILLDSDIPGGMDRQTELYLVSAARAELVRQVIRPLLDQVDVIILDRYSDSSVAYQGYGHGLDNDFIHQINERTTGGLHPDMTILLDLEPATAASRMEGTSDRIEQFGRPFFQRVRDGYLEVARVNRNRFRVIDASADVDKVFQQVVRFVEELLGGKQ